MMDGAWQEGFDGNGDTLALDARDGRVTYRELAQRTRAVRDRATARGRSLALLACENSTAWLVTLLGFFDAGWTVAVVDPSLPARELQRISTSLRPGATLGADGALVFHPAADAALLSSGAALVVFTSGSTGMPKGVLISRENVHANIEWNRALLGLDHTTVASLFLPLSAYMNLSYALAVLAAGGRLVLERNLMDLAGTLARLDAAGVTTLQTVPTALHTIVARGDLARWPLGSLRAIRVGAGRLSSALAEATFAKFPSASLTATYGMTEIGLVAHRRWTAAPIEEGSFDVIEPGVELHLADDDEIVIASTWLFRGYYQLESGTVEAHTGPYATGDLGTRAGRGFTLVSRKKPFAKVAGAQVSLEAVCRIARAQEGVVDVHALARPHPWLGENVQVLVAAAPGSGFDGAALASVLMSELGLRAAPRIITVDALPRNQMGKLTLPSLQALLEEKGDPR
jgi:acyl-CoA synthetase (AMP-forming)/AMP-acid ligase II